MKVYLAGRITGNARYMEEFSEAAAFYKAKGIVVLNPAVLPEGMEYADYARICMAMIDSSDAVVMLPDWQMSLGAKLEKDYAAYCRKAVRYFEDEKTTGEEEAGDPSGDGTADAETVRQKLRSVADEIMEMFFSEDF